MRLMLHMTLAFVLANASAKAMGEDTFFDSGGVRIRYIAEGNGETVILIHGFAGNAETWKLSGVFQSLAKH